MIAYFARHPTAANLLMVAILVLGAAGATTLNRETFPDIPADEVEVRIDYPGAGAGEVEEAVCRRIEDAIDAVDDIDELRCEAREGRAVATAVMTEGGNFDRLLTNVKTEVEAIDDFPAETEPPTVRQLGLEEFVAAIAVTGPMSTRNLKLYAEDLKDRLGRIENIGEIALKGFSDSQIRIEIPALMLRQYGLSVADVARTIGRQSVRRPAGTIETGERDVLLRFDDERRSAREFVDLVVVGAASGAEIRLGDIARITDRFEKDEEKIVFNGRRAALLEVRKSREADTLEVIRAVRAFLEHERGLMPPGVELTITQDISSIVHDRLTMLLENGAQGLALVLLTLTLFFALRFAFWVALGLPVAFAGALFAMAVMGLSIDMITMVGLLIAVGILVDDAIVIAENIASHHADGAPPVEAAIRGTREVATGVLASFATTVLIFGPLAFIRGEIGDILRVMPVVLIVAVSVSLIEAFWILPNHLQHSLGKAATRRSPRLRGRVEAALGWLRERVVGRLADAAVAWRYLTVGLAVLLVLASVAVVASGFLKFQAFPELDGDVIEARILMPPGTPIARTESVADDVVAALGRVERQLPPGRAGQRGVVRNVNVQFNRNVDAFETGPHVATVTVDLLTAEQRSARLDDILGRWREEVGVVPDVLAVKFTDFTVGPGGKPIDIRLHGDDLAELGAAARELRNWLARYHGVADLSDDLRPGKPETRMALRQGAVALGLDAEAVATQLRAAFFGRTASEIQVGPESYEIDVRLPPRDRNSLADLEDFTVTAPDGDQVPLGAVATLELDRGYVRINRIDGRRAVTVQGELDRKVANAGEIVADTRARFLPELSRRFPGVAVQFEGQEKEAGKTAASIRRGFLLGLVGVFLLLSFLFRSYTEPLAVMVMIPMGLVGVVWGHVLMGLELSMPSIVGFVSLAGVAVNNSILLVDFTRRGIASGKSVEAAAREASRRRFRPVLLTSLTTIMGLLPLLTEKSLQAQVLVPLVTSLAFGMLATTLLVLFVVPALYAILDDLGFVRASRVAPAVAHS
ncbi:MAG: efflux RND transporter permease subunit [Alphaproteobacteria bacterium]